MSTNDEKKNLMPVSQIEADKLENLAKETGNFKTWVRTNKEGTEFMVAGEPTGKTEIIGVLIDFQPNWTCWPEDGDKPIKVYEKDMPNEDHEWRRRCDLLMMTAQYGLVVLDLSMSSFRNFGKYASDLKVYRKSLSEVLTRAVIGKAKSKKFGTFTTIRFEIAGVVNGSGTIPMVAVLPPAQEPTLDGLDIEENGEPTEEPPPPDDDFVPY